MSMEATVAQAQLVPKGHREEVETQKEGTGMPKTKFTL